MANLNLPDDLVAFLRAGEQLECDASKCEAGKITLLPLDRLKVEFFPMSSQNPKDPHSGESGCYLVKGVNLVASCDDYEPQGLLLWLPLDERYGMWDAEHGTLRVFRRAVNWSQIAKDIPRHVNANWSLDGSAPASDLLPWVRHSYNPEQLCYALPDIAEWYEASWLRRGICRDGKQLRYPEEIQIRVECDGNQRELTVQVKKAEEAAPWSPAQKLLVAPQEWQQLQPCLESGFWNEPSMPTENHAGETATMWTFCGYRGGRYHMVSRSYDETSGEGDAVHELGKHMARLGNLQRLETDG
jgi:hypothetical protein